MKSEAENPEQKEEKSVENWAFEYQSYNEPQTSLFYFSTSKMFLLRYSEI